MPTGPGISWDVDSFDDAFYIVHVSNIVCASVSIVCSLTILATILSDPKERKRYSSHLLTMLCISELVWQIFHMSDHSHSMVNAAAQGSPLVPFAQLATGSACAGLGFFLEWGCAASWFWVFAIAVNTFQRVMLMHTNYNEIPLWIWHVFCWGASFLLALGPAAAGMLGPANPFWCHIGYQYPKVFLGVFNIPNFFVFFAICILYIIVIIRVWRVSRTSTSSSGDLDKTFTSAIKKMIWYPVVFLIQWFPLFVLGVWVNNYLTTANPMEPLGLDWFVVVSSNCGGFMNLIVFAFFSSHPVWRKVRRTLGMKDEESDVESSHSSGRSVSSSTAHTSSAGSSSASVSTD